MRNSELNWHAERIELPDRRETPDSSLIARVQAGCMGDTASTKTYLVECFWPGVTPERLGAVAQRAHASAAIKAGELAAVVVR